MATTNYDVDHEKAAELDLKARDVRALEEEITVMDATVAPDLDNDEYEVVSESGSDYTVEAGRHGVACDCLDWQRREPDGGCKHIRRVLLETGQRLTHAFWIDQLDVSCQFDGEPRVVPEQGGLETADADTSDRTVVTDGGERPADCCCVERGDREDNQALPCFPCWDDGFRTVNPELVSG